MASQWDDSDWFRSSTWNPDVAAAFEAKLQRTRKWNRAQYLRIQGVHLVAQDSAESRAAGRLLLTRVVDSYSASEDGADRMEALTSLENLADSLARDGELTAARFAYREVLNRVASSTTKRSGTSHTTEISLAELLIADGDPSSLKDAELLLDAAEEQVVQSAFFRNLVLRYLVARFLVARMRAAALRGEASRAAVYAREALSIADETQPSLPRHPDLGRPHASEALRAELQRIAAG